jgi:hypothetical protein
MRNLLIILGLITCISLQAQNTYYVAHPDSAYPGMNQASDANNGSFANPWATWKHGFGNISPGDTLYIRGGVYLVENYPTANIYLDSHVATKSNTTCIYNYPGESPILDYINKEPNNGWNTAILISWSHNIRFKGLTIRNVFQEATFGRIAMAWDCYGISNFHWENCVVHDVNGRGWYVGSIGDYGGWDQPDSTYFINCDAYNMIDSLSLDGHGEPNYGNGADGFFYAADIGYYHMEGCRAWHCSDDGFNTNGQAMQVFKSCWSFDNLVWKADFPKSEGNAFKFMDTYKKVTNCIAANCFQAYNHNNGPNNRWPLGELYNNIDYNNDVGTTIQNIGDSVLISDPTALVYRNNISYQTENPMLNVPTIQNSNKENFNYTESNNTWRHYPFGWGWETNPDYTVTSADFVEGAWDTDQLKAPRKADGSLPDHNFGRLASDSDLKGAGYNVGMSTTPDIGLDFAWLEGDVDSTATDILSFTLPQQTAPGAINFNNHTVAIQVAHGTNVTALTPTISVSYGATIAPTSGTARNFATPQTYVVTALDEVTTQEWTVTVTVASAPPVDPPTERRWVRTANGYFSKSLNGTPLYYSD